MLLFVAKRLVHALPILFGVSLLSFVLIHLMPGSIVDVMVPPAASPDMVAEITRLYGLDRSLPEQYFLWLFQVLHGNFGVSLFSGRPIAADLFAALGYTLQIAIFGALFGFVLGVLFGALAARYAGRWQDKLFSSITIAGVSIPNYWLAIVLVTIFSVEYNVLPAQGVGPSGMPITWAQWSHMLLPIIVLSLIPMGFVGRMVRAAVLEVRTQEFVGALDAKGLTRPRISWHVAKNAAPPVLALMGLQFGYMLGGSILIETVFNWPGTGNLLNLAIFRRDAPVIQAIVLVLAFLFVVVNLVVDVVQAALDPRMRR
jgi:peptide/nickel transport system permease protein